MKCTEQITTGMIFTALYSVVAEYRAVVAVNISAVVLALQQSDPAQKSKFCISVSAD